MGKTIFISLAIIVVCVVISTFLERIKGGKTQKTVEKPRLKMLNRDGDSTEDEWHTYIAGVYHHVPHNYEGGFMGWVQHDAENTHDPNAMGVYNSCGELLGYIPKRELRDYREWCDAQPMPCAGFVFIEDGQHRGRVKILRPCSKDFISNEFMRYLQWVLNNYGEKYLPNPLNIDYDVEE